MAENSKISWTEHTFNPWVGCTKVSPGCAHCYAETLMDHRYGKVKWGPQGVRIRTSAALWKKPLQWNKAQWQECIDCGWRGPVSETHVDCPVCDSEELKPARQRAFSASLADIFELKEDQKEDMDRWRADLFKMIEDTPNLDWLLLTKRIENVGVMMPDAWLSGFPKNVWLGTSVENQKEADERLPILEHLGRSFRPSVIFVSAEPLLSAIDMDGFLEEEDFGDDEGQLWSRPIDWVIAGGESGPKARAMHPDWVRSLRDQCQQSGVAFHFKQWGEWKSADTAMEGVEFVKASKMQMCQVAGAPLLLHRIGKHNAGRLLDGREWNEFPS